MDFHGVQVMTNVSNDAVVMSCTPW